MSLLTVGVFGTSRKKREKRVPIHPAQLGWIAGNIRQNLIFEEGYGLPFGVEDSEIAAVSGGLASREELFERCDIMLLPKPVQEDFDAMKKGAILWGWPHCVQQHSLTQTAIDNRLTLIAWEAMHRWSDHGDWQMHIFHKNNELAGYAGVLHALNLAGIDGNYGAERKAIVISFGSVSRGAVFALQSRGFHDITVFTQRHFVLVADQVMGVKHYHFEKDKEDRMVSLRPDGQTCSFVEDLAGVDIIVNGILQNTDNPLMFVESDEVDKLKRGCLIVDVSCDEGMGFPFARPTTFDEPMFNIGKLHYYAVDHTPSYLWNSASWEISNSLLPYLPLVIGGPETWDKHETLRRAIEIRDGVIQNPKILSFQNREPAYPHKILAQ